MKQQFSKVPELSLRAFTHGSAKDRKDFETGLMAGFQYYGFIILKDHGVSRALLARAYAQSREFFALPEAEKRTYITGAEGLRGYTAFGREHAKSSIVADLKEFWHVGREFAAGDPLSHVYPSNIWPTQPQGFRETFLALYGALEEAGFAMLEALAPSLAVPGDFFRVLATNGNSILRLLHYPPIGKDADPRAVRAAAHEDINLITILVAADGGGLELLDRDGRWLAVETDADNLIVDAGDMLARITNDVIPATTHRVVNSPGSNVASRYSMPFFMHPHHEATLECLPSCRGSGEKYPPIKAGDFLRMRLNEIGLKA
jgi:isopenicillin N synthase-like dioxygenase